MASLAGDIRADDNDDYEYDYDGGDGAELGDDDADADDADDADGVVNGWHEHTHFKVPSSLN